MILGFRILSKALSSPKGSKFPSKFGGFASQFVPDQKFAKPLLYPPGGNNWKIVTFYFNEHNPKYEAEICATLKQSTVFLM